MQDSSTPTKRTDPFDGILLVDKPSGPTSHDVVSRIRYHFRLKKVGHGGTLDPLATGLLVILLGRGTRLAPWFMSSDKIYEGTLRLGVATDTQDAAGRVLREADYRAVTAEALLQQMAPFRGDLLQTPPMVSAIKHDGVPLYKLARRGQDVERKPRLIHIYEFRLLDFNPPDARFILRCTKGTYVRTLCHEVGEKLGCGAHLAQLRRLQSGHYNVADARPMDDLLKLSQGDLIDIVIPLHRIPVGPAASAAADDTAGGDPSEEWGHRCRAANPGASHEGTA
jgi:tRNA pseudouridine55 synthase